jgi:tetratricopeptide (TPR) repeat protein
MKNAVLPALMAAALALGARADAQIPATFKNLQVLPKDVSRAELVQTMRSMATDLGVRCAHCHVGPDDLQGMDFATDEKRAKQVARVMLKMVRSINADFIDTVPAGAGARQMVTCITCHRRATKPTLPLHTILVDTVAAEGATAALAKYSTLRDEFYGSGLYDFREHTLNIVGNRLMEQKRPADAIAVLKKNVELFPKSATAFFGVGFAAQQSGNAAEAEEYFRKALAIDPAHQGALRALEQMKKK